MSFSRFGALAAFIVVVLGGGLLIGYFFTPGEWYQALQKPPFNPPGWVFGPVWTILYIMIAIAGWRVWAGGHARAFQLWLMQMVLNFAWSMVFFGAHQIGVALVVIVAMLALIVAFIVETWSRDRLAAVLFVPYLLWVSFATLLTASIFVLN